MEEDAEDPGGDAEDGEGLVVAAQRVGGGNAAAHLDQPAVVRRHVAEAEQHRERLLHPEHPRERPLPVELRHLLPRRPPPRRHDPLARVVALPRARPEQEPSVEGCAPVSVSAFSGEVHVISISISFYFWFFLLRVVDGMAEM